MHFFWTLFTRPIVALTKPKRILAIAEAGDENIRAIADYCRGAGAHLDIIQPVASPPVIAAPPEGAALHQGKPLDAIAALPAPDVVFLDGDPNWRTTFAEMSQLYARARDTGVAPPIVLAHACAWPYARRDMYRDPNVFLPDERHPHAYRGIRPGQAELGEGGLNASCANATHEGGPENGVLTAIEDFIASWPGGVSLTVLPFLNGLGIVIPEERRSADLDALIASFNSGETLMAACQKLDAHMLGKLAEHAQAEAVLHRRTDALQRARVVIADLQAQLAAKART